MTGAPAEAVPAGGPRATDARVVADLVGTRVAIELAQPGWAARVRALLAPFLVTDPAGAAVGPEPEPDERFTVGAVVGAGEAVLRRGSIEIARGSWPTVEARLLAELNRSAIERYDGFAVHAGVVALGDRVACFPGESGLGKSTMTAACIGAGFAYVSDEALCVEPASGAVVPYPRPLALAPASAALLGIDRNQRPPTGADGELLLTAADLGGAHVEPARRLRLTDVVELRRGASEAHLEPLHRSGALAALLSMSFNHFKDPDASVDVVAALAADVRMWRLHHEDPVEAAALLARAFG